MRAVFALAAVAASAAAPAQQPAIGADAFYSTDADGTEVLRTGINFDLSRSAPNSYFGFRVEKARFNPAGLGWQGRQRVYLRFARPIGKWKAAASIGTDGDTVLGSATLHDEANFRKELFVERDIVETSKGLKRGIYYTFGGAAIDLPVDDRNLFTLVAGLQDFTGDNVRTHLRGSFIHVLKPEAGLSVQLRGRYFRNSEPREYDYYSPRWYAQALPVLQMRRFVNGWRYLVAGGIGVQRDSSSGWRRSMYSNAEVHSPERSRWSVNAAATFSETPTTTGQSYNYLQVRAGVLRRF
jgi:hypothetical protein